jgi:hypothetical protein
VTWGGPRGGPGQLVLRRMALGLAAAGLAVLSGATEPAQAQQATISVAARVATEPGIRTPLGIRIGPAAALPRSSFLRIRGLPPTASLSDGHAIAPGSWAIPITAVDDLGITMAPDAPARSDIVVTLVSVEGTVLAEARSTLTVAAAGSPVRGAQREPDAKAPSTATSLRAGTEPPNEARPTFGGPGLRSSPSMTREDRDRAIRLMQKGDEHLADGNVSAARLMFERAADVGLAQAAMALAATFDADELARLSVRGGIQPDSKEARRWYERALQLGAADAEPRLRRLGSN